MSDRGGQKGAERESQTARDTAIEIAKLNGFCSLVWRAVDNEFEKKFPCWVVSIQSNNAVVIYEDEPETVTSTGNHPGRFLPLSECADVMLRQAARRRK